MKSRRENDRKAMIMGKKSLAKNNVQKKKSFIPPQRINSIQASKGFVETQTRIELLFCLVLAHAFQITGEFPFAFTGFESGRLKCVVLCRDGLQRTPAEQLPVTPSLAHALPPPMRKCRGGCFGPSYVTKRMPAQGRVGGGVAGRQPSLASPHPTSSSRTEFVVYNARGPCGQEREDRWGGGTSLEPISQTARRGFPTFFRTLRRLFL